MDWCRTAGEAQANQCGSMQVGLIEQCATGTDSVQRRCVTPLPHSDMLLPVHVLDVPSWQVNTLWFILSCQYQDPVVYSKHSSRALCLQQHRARRCACHAQQGPGSLEHLLASVEGSEDPPRSATCDEVRRQRSIRMKQRWADPATRAQLCATFKGRVGGVGKPKVHSAAARAKMAASHYGHSVSPETRAKIGAAHQGRKKAEVCCSQAV